jgi:hypothetical protein
MGRLGEAWQGNQTGVAARCCRLDQNALSKPACLSTALAVCLDLQLLSTTKFVRVCGDHQI